ncbi:F-box protein [Wickerhamomyces ciferrii]|uniref:F-box protein n=1 Tax=Wickerhamomyces ciferrii (strain ATCC 14091 / BCRC 22168 / CBS 111 / JCM 3599 / NBRC 0793 / NRRL Y-1031 F-60-10) TaxID=1206466 RepID=K0KWV2_WICCF|nr:F-box protein [Wickerhamomyces ciferrii]CCH46522.1 F-box protein [Wickerhamomyces ciferrii]
MANKRRPKKARVPYRRYGPGSINKNGNNNTGEGHMGSEDEDEEDEVEQSDVMKSSHYNNINYDDYSSTSWPISKFQKIDVLKFAIINEKLKNGEFIEIPITFTKNGKNGGNVKSLHLPVEILQLILRYIPKTDPKYLRVSKLFYQLYIPILYHSPILNSYNFFQFVDTLSSIKNKVGKHVKILDLSTIIQSGKNSYVSKLLRRCSENLEVFVAPQTSFGYAPLVSLRGCNKIKVLDLRLVSETMNLKELFYSIRNSKDLTHLSFPRSSITCEDINYNSELEIENFWPPNIWYLRLSGGVSDEFIMNSILPKSITRLEFAHCPSLKEFAVYSLLSRFGRNLTHLSIQYPMPGLTENSMDYIFQYCPNLIFLQITVDYCSKDLFSEDFLPPILGDKPRCLKTLWIESSGGLGQGAKIHPDDLTIALLEERLPMLKNIRITSKLGWDLKSDDVADLINALEEKDGGLYIHHY